MCYELYSLQRFYACLCARPRACTTVDRTKAIVSWFFLILFVAKTRLDKVLLQNNVVASPRRYPITPHVCRCFEYLVLSYCRLSL